MEKISRPALPFVIRNYCFLTKPGILFGNAITAIAGFVLGSFGRVHFGLFLMTLFGLICVMASACVFNNCIDQEYDAKMPRTQNRALVKGHLSTKQAILFAVLLGLFGAFFLGYFVNLLSLTIAAIGFLIYVLFYSFSKHTTHHATLIGSFAGATPPVVGYTAVTHQFDLAALLLFILLVFWQMPHFYAIALYRIEDYHKASLPVLPLKKGVLRTKIEMTLYVVAFLITLPLFTWAGYTNSFFCLLMTLLGLFWLLISIRGFRCKNDQVWGRKMFLFSLMMIMAFSFLIPLSLSH